VETTAVSVLKKNTNVLLPSSPLHHLPPPPPPPSTLPCRGAPFNLKREGERSPRLAGEKFLNWRQQPEEHVHRIVNQAQREQDRTGTGDKTGEEEGGEDRTGTGNKSGEKVRGEDRTENGNMKGEEEEERTGQELGTRKEKR